MLNIDEIEVGAVTVLRLQGDIDDEGVGALRVSLLECLRERRCRVVVNLSDVQYLSYLGIGILIERLRQLHKQGGDLKIVGANVYAQRIFRMAGVSAILRTYESEASAIQGMRQAA